MKSVQQRDPTPEQIAEMCKAIQRKKRRHSRWYQDEDGNRRLWDHTVGDDVPARMFRINDRGLSPAQRIKRGEMDTDPSNL
jgi:hypothetical protein